MQLQTSNSLYSPMRHSFVGNPPPRATQPGGIAVFMVGGDLAIRSTNGAGRSLMSSEIVQPRRFATADSSLNSKLQRWMREQVARNAPDELHLRLDTDCGRTFAITAVFTGCDADMGDEPEIVILVQEPQAAGRSKVALVAAAHGLTPSEARLLELVFQGLDTPAAAERLGVSKTTARTHLQRIFSKTDTARQSALVHFVATFVTA